MYLIYVSYLCACTPLTHSHVVLIGGLHPLLVCRHEAVAGLDALLNLRVLNLQCSTHAVSRHHMPVCSAPHACVQRGFKAPHASVCSAPHACVQRRRFQGTTCLCVQRSLWATAQPQQREKSSKGQMTIGRTHNTQHTVMTIHHMLSHLHMLGKPVV